METSELLLAGFQFSLASFFLALWTGQNLFNNIFFGIPLLSTIVIEFVTLSSFPVVAGVARGVLGARLMSHFNKWKNFEAG